MQLKRALGGLLASSSARPVGLSTKSGGASPRRRGHVASLALLVGAILMPLANLGVGAYIAWREVWRDAAADLVRSADAAAEYARRVLDIHESAVARVDDLLRGLAEAEIRAREAELREAILRFAGDVPGLRAALLLGRDGAPLLEAQASPASRGERGVAWAEAIPLGDAEGATTRFGRIPAREEAGPLLVLAREAGAGMVAFALGPAPLAAGLRHLLHAEGDVLALLGADGHWLAHSGAARLPPFPAASSLHAAIRDAVAAALAGSSPPGKEGWQVATRQVAGFPVYAVAARPHDAILAQWRSLVMPQLAIALPAAALLLVLALMVRRGEASLVEANNLLEQRVAERTGRLAELTELLDLAPSIVFELDGTITYWSAGAERLFGFTAAEALGRRAGELLRTEWPAGGRWPAIRSLLETGEWHGELRQRHKDGTLVITAAHWILRRDPLTGAAGPVVSYRTDITGQRRVEDALRTSEAWLRRAQEASGVVPFELTQEGRIAATEALCLLFDLSPDQPPEPGALHARLHPEDRRAVLLAIRRLAARGGVFEREFRILRADGAMRWLLVRGEAEPHPERRPLPRRIMGVVLDITARKRAEAALAESEARLRLAQQAAGIGIFDHEFRTGRVEWDAVMRALWGVPEGVPVTRRLLLEGLHPEDRRRRRQAIRRATAPGGDGLYQMDYRVIRRSDGEERWIAAHGMVRREAGGPTRLIGVAMDITERKRAEERNELLRREVDHRAKNALAVVQAALRLSRADTPAELIRVVEGRVAALARAQTALARRRWQGAELRPLLEGELAPFLVETPGAPYATLSGPPVTIGAEAAQPLCMALHELATNALKYGALSRPEGRLSVAWGVDAARGRLRILWQEQGGPEIPAAPGHRGFGSRVLEQTIRTQLSGTVTRLWRRGGLHCEIEVPLRQKGWEVVDSAAA
jgi:PAS domain S-box-containing protein